MSAEYRSPDDRINDGEELTGTYETETGSFEYSILKGLLGVSVQLSKMTIRFGDNADPEVSQGSPNKTIQLTGGSPSSLSGEVVESPVIVTREVTKHGVGDTIEEALAVAIGSPEVEIMPGVAPLAPQEPVDAIIVETEL